MVACVRRVRPTIEGKRTGICVEYPSEPASRNTWHGRSPRRVLGGTDCGFDTAASQARWPRRCL
jgi:hypothetical protein